MVSDADARAILVSRFPSRSPAWYQATQAILRGEGDYGNGWKNGVVDGKGKPWIDPSQGPQFVNQCAGSNNWGADQTKASDPNGCPNLDHHGDGSPYQAHFKTYANPEDGAADAVFVLTDNGPGPHNRASVAAALDDANADGNLNADAIAEAMHMTGYFELRTDLYAAGIVRNAIAIAKKLGEPQRVFRASDLPSPSLLASSSTGVVELSLVAVAAAFALFVAFKGGLIA
jgi:hypothetical protein